ncbi:MAG: PLDc N-terminal domain-containing protein [Patescibacteria group bacterium]|nr:PLDc N-terminal domain-containing protein [Patescibacteria group bacterium]
MSLLNLVALAEETYDTTNADAAAAAVVTGIGAFFMIFMLIAVVIGIFTLWMLIDSIIRQDADFPQGQPKIMWILLILFIPFASIAYFFMVKRAGKKAPAAAPAPEAPKE